MEITQTNSSQPLFKRPAVRRWLIIAALVSLAVLCFLKVDPLYDSVDKRIYTYYAVSFAEDLDLNVVNQIPRKEAWLLTTTLNYPDIHSNGIAVLWSPFFFVGNYVGEWAGLHRDSVYRTTMALTAVFWGLLAIPILWRLLRRHFSASDSLSGLGLLLIASPFYYYLVHQPENADISGLFLSASLYLYHQYRKEIDPRTFTFFLGLMLFFGVAVKFDIVFAGLLFVHYLYERCVADRSPGQIRRAVEATFFFGLGSALVIVPILSNEALKNGFIGYTYFDIISPTTFLIWEFMFGPSGYFTTNPFYAVLIVLFLVLGIRRRFDAEWWFYFSIPMSKFILQSFTFDQNEHPGPRLWLVDTPAFALIVAKTYSELGEISWRRAFWATAVLSMIVSETANLVYRLNYEAFFFKMNWFDALDYYGRRQNIWTYFYELHWFDNKLAMLPLFVLVAVLLAVGVWAILNTRRIRSLQWLFGALAFAYLLVTVSNFRYSAESVAKTPKDVIEKAVIGNGHEINSFFENAGCLQRAVEYYNRQGEPAKAKQRQAMLEDYVERAASQIVKDPIAFKATLVPGRKEYVPRILWAD